MGARKIPSECLWLERWPVWGYVCIESVQFCSFGPLPLTKTCFLHPCTCKTQNIFHTVSHSLCIPNKKTPPLSTQIPNRSPLSTQIPNRH